MWREQWSCFLVKLHSEEETNKRGQAEAANVDDSFWDRLGRAGERLERGDLNDWIRASGLLDFVLSGGSGLQADFFSKQYTSMQEGHHLVPIQLR